MVESFFCGLNAERTRKRIDRNRDMSLADVADRIESL